MSASVESFRSPLGLAAGSVQAHPQCLAHALAYAAQGLPVLPLAPAAKQPAGDLVRNGFRDASTDQDIIRRWFAARPDAGVGIVPGPARLLVLDLDDKPGRPRGVDSLEALEARHGLLPATLVQRTASGGAAQHRVFRLPAGVDPASIGNSVLAPGIDVRCSAGYIAAEPTRLGDGGTYTFDDWDVTAGEVPDIAEAPTWLLAELVKSAPPAVIQSEVDGPPQIIAPAQVTELRSALNFLDPVPYESWIANGQRLKCLGNVGREIWMTWSAQSPSFDAAQAAAKWETFNGDRTGYAAVFAEAQAGGWVNPASNAARVRTVGSGGGDRASAINLVSATAETLPSDWPEPRPIKADLPPAPAFDGHALLPPVLADFVLDEADRMPCAPDYIAAALIVALGSVIGARCALKPKRRDDWIVTPNLFGGLVGEPSSKKTPAASIPMRFLDRLEVAESERKAEEMKVYAAKLAAFEARKGAIQEAMKRAARGRVNDDQMEEATHDLADLKPPEEPVRRRFKTSDATVPMLGILLAKNPAGLLVLRDELMGLLASWDREGNEGDRAFYLEGWNGTGSFSVDRVTRGSNHVANLCLSVFGGIQPDLMARYLASSVAGLDNDGRTQRFQVMVYPESVRWEWRDRYPVKSARERVRAVFERLADLDPLQAGASPASDFVKLPHLGFDDAAQEVFIEWCTELNTVRIPAEATPLLRQHLAKFEKLFCSIALILHFSEGHVGPVGVESAARAAVWCQYLEDHARRIYGLVEIGRVSAAQLLGRRIHAGKLADGFTARDVFRKGWTGLETMVQVEAALDLLQEHGWVIAVETDNPTGRNTFRHYINPKSRPWTT